MEETLRNHTWKWAGAVAIGSSHIASGKECQDRACALEIQSANDGKVLISIVSDGAGSKKKSATGSKVVCMQFTRLVNEYLKADKSISDIDEDLVRSWIDTACEKLSAISELQGSKLSQYASTLVMAIIGERDALIAQIGDGACLIKTCKQDDWQIPIWPMNGEYASSTYFVTQGRNVKLAIERIEADVEQIAIFSDGIERLALNFKENSIHADFVEALIKPLASGNDTGRNRKLSKQLRQWLSSKDICEKTDDDKSLIIAKRITE